MFMMLIITTGYESATLNTMPNAKVVEVMTKYNESLQQAGVPLSLDGLHLPLMGIRVTFSGGKPKITDGLFPEVKEVLGGYWMIQVRSKEEAVKRASSDNGIIAVRQVHELSNFNADVQAAAASWRDG